MVKSAVALEQRDGVARLTLRAPAWERVDAAALRALARHCEALRDDTSIHAVIVTGEGGRFCGTWPEGATPSPEMSAAFEPLATLSQAVIAAVNGPAHGAALELALAADVRLAGDGASFALLGGPGLPLAGGLTRLSRVVGRGAATWMALTGAHLSAEEALVAGLVSVVAPPDTLLAEAERLAGVIATRGPIAIRFAKEALRHGPDMTLPQALRFETDLTVILQTTDDRAEGVAAFVEKRRPKFTGQ